MLGGGPAGGRRGEKELVEEREAGRYSDKPKGIVLSLYNIIQYCLVFSSIYS